MTVWVLLPSLQFDADVRHAWQYFALHVVANGDVQRVVLIELHERDGEVVLVIAYAFAPYLSVLAHQWAVDGVYYRLVGG